LAWGLFVGTFSYLYFKEDYSKMSARLILLRHGQSVWNAQNRFTGFKDVDLTDLGVAEATQAGQGIRARNLRVDAVFTSTLLRAYRTAALALAASSPLNDHLRMGDGWAMTRHDDLRERDYGDLTGLNKDEIAAKYGAEQVHIWRRSYDVRPPGGESLADVVARSGPYFDAHIRPLLDAGKTVLVAAHGNTVRALLVHLGENTPENIAAREIQTGVPIAICI
jgi:2,3-bisphosphoglycerate-dependent phosphoglycerate mutase